jgi:phosphoglycolate phosphatase
LKNIKGIIFDLDGTLLDTLEDLTDSVNHVMRKFSLETKSLEQVRSYVGNGVVNLIEQCVPGSETHVQFSEILNAFMDYYEKNCDHKTKPYDGVLVLIEKLHSEGRQLGIVSNKFDRAVKELNRQYFHSWIDFALGVTNALHRKPAPDMVYACIEQMHLKPEEVVFIGDSEVDLKTAQNAGIKCISVLWGFRSHEVLIEYGATQIVSTVKELEDVLKELQ